MTTDSTGFRSLVEQMQQREFQTAPQRPIRERTRAESTGGRKTKSGNEIERAAPISPTAAEPIGFLGRRWL